MFIDEILEMVLIDFIFKRINNNREVNQPNHRFQVFKLLYLEPRAKEIVLRPNTGRPGANSVGKNIFYL